MQSAAQTFKGRQASAGRYFMRRVVPLVLVAACAGVPVFARGSIRGAARADFASRGYTGSAFRESDFNRDANFNGNDFSNFNANRNADLNVNREFSGNTHVVNNARFWGGAATGAAGTLAVGAAVKSIPANPRIIALNNRRYYYAEGLYYQDALDGYVVANAPTGATITALPPGTMTVNYNGFTYYYAGGAFYVQDGMMYVVVNTPIGITVPALPPGATMTTIGGNPYYAFNGIYYKPAMQYGEVCYTTVQM